MGCRSRRRSGQSRSVSTPRLCPPTGSIYGTALDEQGSPLPGVEVKLQGAGERAPVQTDSQGRFRFLYISPGTDSVTLSLDGFATVENRGIVVALDRSTQLRVTIANTFAIGPVSVTPSFNVFNAANANTIRADAV